jgi:hypothetical protein
MVLLGVKAEVEARFGLFGDNANLTQDRCTVYTKDMIGSNCYVTWIMWNLISGCLEMVLVLV